jgi:hypothetical protein
MLLMSTLTLHPRNFFPTGDLKSIVQERHQYLYFFNIFG